MPPEPLVMVTDQGRRKAQAFQSPEHEDAKRLQWRKGYSLWNGRSWLREGTTARYRDPGASGRNSQSVQCIRKRHMYSSMLASIHSFTYSCLCSFIHSLESSPMGCGFHRSRNQVPLVTKPLRVPPTLQGSNGRRVITLSVLQPEPLPLGFPAYHHPRAATKSYCD